MYETISPDRFATHGNKIKSLNKQSSQLINDVQKQTFNNKNTATTKKVYEGLQLLTNKQLTIIENK